MNLYELKNRFDPDTGKPLSQKKRRLIGLVCDYCGKFHSSDEGDLADPTIQLVHDGAMEPQFHEFTLRIGEEEVDLYELYDSHPQFYYCQDFDTGNHCDQLMVAEWLNDITNGKGLSKSAAGEINRRLKKLTLPPLRNRGSSDVGPLLCHGMFAARHRIITQLIDSKTYTAEQLNLEFK